MAAGHRRRCLSAASVKTGTATNIANQDMRIRPDFTNVTTASRVCILTVGGCQPPPTMLCRDCPPSVAHATAPTRPRLGLLDEAGPEPQQERPPASRWPHRRRSVVRSPRPVSETRARHHETCRARPKPRPVARTAAEALRRPNKRGILEGVGKKGDGYLL